MVDGLPVVAVRVHNSGDVAGSEVVQYYVSDPESALPRPEKELKGFSKVFLQPGESKQGNLNLPRSAFEYFDDREGKWVLEPGKFEILVGTSSREIHFSQSVML